MKRIKRTDRIGETRKNNYGSEMTIIAYKNSLNITIQFKDTDYITEDAYSSFYKGLIKSPYDRTILKVGYIGNGNYKPYFKNIQKTTPQYDTWSKMFARCYSIKTQERQPAYIGCTVCEEWHNFQNFAKWYEDNYYEIEGEIMNLDKDILIKGNKIYSPDTCIFVPQVINTLFTKRNSKRGNFPIGITFRKKSNNYEVSCHNEKGKYKYLGRYHNIIEAFNVYKNFKEIIIKNKANNYKNYIPQKLYDVMYNYVVEITD